MWTSPGQHAFIEWGGLGFLLWFREIYPLPLQFQVSLWAACFPWASPGENLLGRVAQLPHWDFQDSGYGWIPLWHCKPAWWLLRPFPSHLATVEEHRSGGLSRTSAPRRITLLNLLCSICPDDRMCNSGTLIYRPAFLATVLSLKLYVEIKEQEN